MSKETASRINELLSPTGKTLSTAESCTGGNIAHIITSISGASCFFKGAVVAYSAEIKCTLLGVDPKVIETKGIVSSDVAVAMAEGAKRLTGSDYSVATTGWAEGPGDEHECGGCCWIAVSGPSGTVSVRSCNNGSRISNIDKFSDVALLTLLEYITDSLNK